jgi:hypothetical protein
MTVEELRTAVKTIISVPSLICGDPIDTESMALVDALISAAKEEERERIRQESVGSKAIDITAGSVEYPTANDTLYWRMAYIVPYSVLAPKEKS